MTNHSNERISFSNLVSRITSISLFAAIALPLSGFVRREQMAMSEPESLLDQHSVPELVVQKKSAGQFDLVSIVQEAQKKNAAITVIPGKLNSADSDKVSAARGFALYNRMGCVACHSNDGSDSLGPTWKGIWGRSGETSTGQSYVVNAAFVKESVESPSAKVKKGYSDMMPSYKGTLSDDQIKDIVSYMNSISIVPAVAQK